ncbi:FxSxx-COOH system tetratricopeptide repeat protein [Actinoplanes sp. NPDC048796]|uniref:FxSxx-COOH system tetratricopeptide repeat protein n=1 Tax=Actinoplanes sp. NPDC048796 TaxID=3155640 RepID=UPI0034044CBB
MAVTGDGARVDARRIELRRPSAAPDIVGRLTNLPRPPVRLFVGREDALAALDEVMAGGRGVITQAVHGLGGVGKSEMALQYAHRHRDRYQVRWWISCDNPDTITTSLADLTTRLNADLMVTATPLEAATWAIGWLQNQSGWLLILDNVEELADVEQLLAQLDTGHVLITTRRDLDWEHLLDGCLRLELLDREPAVRLLLERSGQTDQLTAAVLADELGYLPLALQQAAGYLRQTRTPMAAYLDRLRSQPETVLNAIAPGTRAERAVAQVWLVTLNRLREQRPAAIEMLRLLACFAPDEVPRAYLADEPHSEQELAVLASYNLVALTDETVSMHRLLQWVVREQAKQDKAAGQALERAIAVLRTAMPDGSPSEAVDTWPEWALLAPHIDAVERAVPEELADADFAILIGQLGFFYATQGRHAAALEVEHRALTIIEAVVPDGDPHIALRLDNLANTLVLLGRPGEALSLQQRALRITEAALPVGHPDIAVRLDNLAYTLGDLGRVGEALPLQQRALRISEAALPEGHPDIALRLDNLAYTLGDLGRVGEALPLRQRALRISEAALPEGHPDIALRLNNLAHTLRALGRVGEALPLQQRALRISEAALPEGHPDIATPLDNLAQTLVDSGRAGEALPLQQRALRISEAALPEGHPDIAIRLDNLAYTLMDLGRAGEALLLRQRALRISEAALPEGHPDIALRLENLAYTLRALGRTDDAAVLRRRAAAMHSRTAKQE